MIKSFTRKHFVLYIQICLFILLSQTNASFISSQIKLSSYNGFTTSSCVSQGLDYLDSSEQRCRSCPSDQVASTSSYDGLGNSEHCQCQQGFKQGFSLCTSTSGSCQSFNCTSCLIENKVSYSDLSGCASCASSTTGSIDTDNDCACPNSNQVLLETDSTGAKLASKICMTCPTRTLPVKSSQSIAGKYYQGSKYQCQTCPDAAHMTMSLVNNVYACTCDLAYRTAGYPGIGEQSCIPNALAAPFISVLSAAKTINYKTTGITVFNSRVFEHYFLSAASGCSYYGGAQDNALCQVLANLCVLQLYDKTTEACSLFLNLVQSGRDTNIPGNEYNISYWSYHMPWLYYTPLYTGNRICKYDVHSAQVSLNNYEMEYRVAVYYMNGTLKGYENLNTLFSYCSRQAPLSSKGGGESASTKWQYFATSEKLSYSCSLRSLLLHADNSETLVSEMLFYELFLFDRTTLRFTPIPTILTLSSSSAPSTTSITNDLCADEDVLVRRFYLFDGISGIETVNSDPRVMRYASKITLTTQLIPQDGEGAKGASTDHIYAPVLRIEYKESVPSTWPAIVERLGTASTASATTTYSYTDSYVSYTFAAYYISDLSHFFATFQGFSIAMFIIFIFFFGLRYHNWNMRHARIITQAGLTTDLGGANVKLCGEIMLLLLSSFVLIFFPYVVILSWYFFVFFKMQVVPSIMLPVDEGGSAAVTAESPYYSFVVGLYVITFFQVFYVLVTVVYRQSQIDVFLLDWEPFHNSALQTMQPGGTKPTLQNQSQSTGNQGKNRTMAQRTKEQQQVSVWRTLMVANEYSELQIERRSDIHFTLFWLGFFLIGLNLQYNATPQPALNDVSPGHTNMLLRFAVSTFFWLILSVAQYLWKWIIYERYFSEPPEQRFLDFCTIAKVSVFILDEKFHGFYLHCRSPYPHAEANMMELVDMLNQEEAGLTTDRSLDGAPADVQSFQLFISSETRDALNQIYDVLAKPMSMTEMIDQRRNRSALAASANNNNSRMSSAAMSQNNNNNNNNSSNNNNGIMSSNIFGGRRSGLGAFRQGGSGNSFKMGFSAFHSIPTERVVQAWQEMTSFLQQWVENNLSASGLRRTIHEPSYLERMMYSAPDLTQSTTPSVFYTDRAWRFTETMFLGREMDLLLFNILVYSMVDLWFASTLVSILLCYLANYGITYLRMNYGSLNLSRKTLVDPRFLI